jgi:SRSO17 transposase
MPNRQPNTLLPEPNRSGNQRPSNLVMKQVNVDTPLSSYEEGTIRLEERISLALLAMVGPHATRSTLRFVDEYCELYAHLFPEVRSFAAFKYLHIGMMISELKRKTLPAIAQAVGLDNEQGLHHLLSKSPWSVARVRQTQLKLILQLVNGQSMILRIDETGNCKKGNSTDYVKRQHIGNVGKKENGTVAVTAYGLFKGMIVPWCFEVYKPRERTQSNQ